jgi:hypothetical protein
MSGPFTEDFRTSLLTAAMREDQARKFESMLADFLAFIKDIDPSRDVAEFGMQYSSESRYRARNGAIEAAIGVAGMLGLKAGYGVNGCADCGAGNLDYPLIGYIELPTGQVSWHLPEFDGEWDGHTSEQKYDRIAKHLATRGHG